jgi:hypothetical protein
MTKNLRRMYLWLGDKDYGQVEADFQMYVGFFLFGRHLKPSEVSYRDWDVYGIKFTEESEDNIWDTYHLKKCAEYYPSRLIVIMDRFTWGFFDERPDNMILMDQPNWANIVKRHLESK